MKRIFSLLLAAITALCALSACGDSAAPPDETEAAAPGHTAAPTEDNGAAIPDEMRAELNEAFDDILTQRLFEGAVYIVYKGEEVYAGAKGYAVKADKIPNSVDAVYQIASNTKQFTAAAILKLCEEGRLSLDDTLRKYFPEYETGRDITIHSLLSMQSGIRDFLRSYDDNGSEVTSSTHYIDGVSDTNTAEQNRAALERFIFESELLFPQGERYSYSNSNYYLLGRIVEQVSGMSCHEYMRKNFFDPLEMHTAGFIDDYDHPGAIVARGYRGGNATGWLSYTGIPFGSGDIMASPKDLYKWSTALHTGRVLGDEMYQKMIAVQCADAASGTNYGYGLMIQKNIGATLCYHSGNIPGFTSATAYIPGQDFFIAAISNYSNENTMTVAAKLIEIMTERMNR